MMSAPAPAAADLLRRSRAPRTLLAACAAHALHDGYTDSIYVLLPVWQIAFGLDYAALAALRGLYAGTMAALQLPAGRLAERMGARGVLALGTLLAALGYGLAGAAGGLLVLYAGLALGGAGSSTQHPLASALVARAYGEGARGPLGTYNFAGDVGKAVLPALAALLLPALGWRSTLWLLAALGAAAALGLRAALPESEATVPASAKGMGRPGRGRGGFPLLLLIGVLDSAARMGFLTFLPFLLRAKGAGLPLVGIALAAVFVGGAAGKFACGWLGARIGLLATVVATEGGTALAILAVLALPLAPCLFVLPLLGVMLNGTSSVLYGTVPELAARPERAFAVFYTGTIGSGAVAPILYGVLGDAAGADWAILAAAATALLAVPLAVLLAPRLADRRGG